MLRRGRDPGREGLVALLNAIALARAGEGLDPAARRAAVLDALRAAGLREDEARRLAELVMTD